MPSSHRPLRILHGFEELKGGWNLEGMCSASPMQHHAWVRACAETLAPRGQLRVLVAGDLDDPDGIVPLVETGNGLTRLELLGPSEVHEPMDLIYRNETVLQHLAEGLLQLRTPLLLRRVPADSKTFAVLRSAWHRRGVVVSRPARGCPSLTLDAGWTDRDPPLASSKRRSDLRRARRRAEKIGPLTHQIITPQPEELDPLLEEVFRVEGASWKMDAGTALAADPPRASFYKRFSAAACRTGILRLCFLRIGECTAAVQLAAEVDQRFWLLKIGYNEEFRDCSPGTILVAETVRHAAQGGLLSYEFLGIDEPWIEVWTKQVRPHLDLHAYPLGLPGGVALAGDALRSAWHRVPRLGVTDS